MNRLILPAFRNKRGDLAVTILTLGIIAMSCFVLITFLTSNTEIRKTFVGIGAIEKMNANVEAGYNRSVAVYSESKSDLEIVKNAISHAKENLVGDRKCSCGSNCDRYAEFLVNSSINNNISSPLFLLALMMQESACKNDAFSGSSTGLMQINLIHCGKYGLPSDKTECKKELMENPQLNIEIGAKILREYYDLYKGGKTFQGCSKRNITYYEWEAALRAYNGWGCNSVFSAQDYFVEDIVERYELLGKIGGGTYTELTETEGILFWQKESFVFSAEYKGSP